MLTFAAITPHSPLLTPTFAKKDGAALKNTKKALEELEKEYYLSKPDTLILITPHSPCIRGAFTVNICTNCETNYKHIGDLATTQTYLIDLHTGNAIKEHGQLKGFEIQMQTDQFIDHGVGAPLQYLSAHLPKLKIVPVGICDLDAKTHFNFGYILKEVAMTSHKSVGIVASADLSHALTTESPAGFRKQGHEFDEKIQEALKSGNSAALLTWDEKFISEASACGFKPIVTLLGATQRMHHTLKILSYEAPFGVGYMVANFSL